MLRGVLARVLPGKDPGLHSCDDELAVTNLAEGGVCEAAGVRPGMKLVAFNELPIGIKVSGPCVMLLRCLRWLRWLRCLRWLRWLRWLRCLSRVRCLLAYSC